MATAASVFTTPPLRKVFDVTLAGTADTGTIAIAHGIDFTDGTAMPPVLTEVIAANFGTGAATGAVPYITSIDATNLNIGFSPAAAGVARLNIQRMHSIQG